MTPLKHSLVSGKDCFGNLCPLKEALNFTSIMLKLDLSNKSRKQTSKLEIYIRGLTQHISWRQFSHENGGKAVKLIITISLFFVNMKMEKKPNSLSTSRGEADKTNSRINNGNC